MALIKKTIKDAHFKGMKYLWKYSGSNMHKMLTECVMMKIRRRDRLKPFLIVFHWHIGPIGRLFVRLSTIRTALFFKEPSGIWKPGPRYRNSNPHKAQSVFSNYKTTHAENYPKETESICAKKNTYYNNTERR